MYCRKLDHAMRSGTSRREGFDHFVVPKAIKVFTDGHCEVYALREVTTIASTPALEGMPSIVSPKNVLSAIRYIADLKVCCGNRNTEVLELCQARIDLFLGKDGQKTNYVDKRISFKPDCPAKDCPVLPFLWQ